MKNFLTLAIAALALGLSACATTTSGPTDPFLSMIIPSTLDQNAAILTDYATLNCNAGAADQYNQNMMTCANPQAFINALPPIPLSTITPATELAALTFICTREGYPGTPPGPATIMPGPPSVCVATPAGKANAEHARRK